MTDRLLAIRQAGTGQWQAVSSPVAPVLRPFVLGPYVGWTESTVETVRRRALPNLFVPVILNFDAHYKVAGSSKSSFLAGLQTSHTMVESKGRVECIQVNLTTDAACRLLRRPIGELSGRIEAIDDILGSDATGLVERLGNTAGWAPALTFSRPFFCADCPMQPACRRRLNGH